MKIKKLNENTFTKKDELKRALVDKAYELFDKRVANIKQFEIAFQDVIEQMFPEKSWWDVTDCNIFMSLLNGKNPMATIDEIVDEMKLDESLREAFDDGADGWNTDELSDLMELLEEIGNLEYELKSCRRGSLTFCKDAKELGRYIIKLGKELTDHGYDIQYRAEEEDD